MQIKKNTTVSIIIPILNEENNLPTLFESIRNQALSDDIKIIDIIAVDNGSVDRSIEISRKFCTDIYYRPDDSIADMRNCGSFHSSGDILIFLDADCVLSTDVVETVVVLLKDNMISAVGPDGLIPLGEGTWVQNVWYLHTRVLGNEVQNIEVENLSSGFFGIKSNNFLAVGGFNGALSIGEDTDISRKLRSKGLKLIKSNKLRVYNSGHPATILRFMKREYWHGDSFKHLLIHKKIELLTLYFIVNALTLLFSSAASILFKSLSVFVIYLLASSVIPMIKAIKKVPKLDLNTIRLFFLYMLYINARTFSLFKIK